MLRIYICPKCYNFRIVSRKPDAICFHCGTVLQKSELDYAEFVDMTEEQRERYKEKFVKRMKLYEDKVNALLNTQELKK